MKKRTWILALALAAISAEPALAADPATIDWSKLPASTVTLFYPGQSSYEWLRNNHKDGKDGKGAKAVQRGETCIKCHVGEEKELGAKLVMAGPLEPTPVKA